MMSTQNAQRYTYMLIQKEQKKKTKKLQQHQQLSVTAGCLMLDSKSFRKLTVCPSSDVVSIPAETCVAVAELKATEQQLHNL